jgi:high affinity Mn2+ porin
MQAVAVFLFLVLTALSNSPAEADDRAEPPAPGARAFLGPPIAGEGPASVGNKTVASEYDRTYAPPKPNTQKNSKDREENKCMLVPVASNYPAPTAILPGSQPGFDTRYSGPNSLILLTNYPALAQADSIASEGKSDKASAMPKPSTEKNGKDTDPDKKANANDNGNGNKDEKDKDKEEDKFKLLPEGWNFHAQTTIIPNFQPGFGAQYSGPNSLGTDRDRRGTIVADLFFGVPMWYGAEFHVDLLLWQGFGLSNSFGLEAFPDADAYKAGTVDPRFMFSHFFVRQTFGLGGEQEDVPNGQFTLPGKQDVSRITMTVGRLNMAELFDNNTYNHDPHTQFMSWAGTMLSWDYPADTVGFTTGIAFELNQPEWAVRYGWFQLPSRPNGFTSDDRIFMWPVEAGEKTSDGEFWKQWGMMLELERRWRLADHPGAIRLQAWTDYGRLASFSVATRLLLASPPPPNTPAGAEITVPAAAFAFRDKYGFGLNWEQEIATNVGTFGRFGWQDGHVAAATFTDADWTLQLGLSVKGAGWRRPGDTFGLLGNLVGASSQQQAFLKAGGTGILNGDGNLSYGCEKSIETYYDLAITKDLHLAFDYQFFADLAFNRDRGPVNVFAARLHWGF